MASVSTDPLQAIAYRTGIQTFTGTTSVPTFRAYEFADVNDFSEAIVRFQDISIFFQQNLTANTYSLKGPGDPGYDPDNPSSYISRTATASISFTFKYVHTDNNNSGEVGANEIIPAAPFRQRENRFQMKFPWEYDNFDTSTIESTLDVGDWTVTNYDSSGSSTSSDSGDVYPVSGDTRLAPEYSTNKWYLENQFFDVGISTRSDTSATGRILPTDLELGEAADFEPSARVSMPTIPGSSVIDFMVGVPVGQFPSDSDFSSGPPQFRFTQSTTITPSLGFY